MTENPKTTFSKEFSAVLSPTAREGGTTDNPFGAFRSTTKSLCTFRQDAIARKIPICLADDS
jgi:hypothetical protein